MEVKTVPASVSGVSDGVEAMTSCGVTEFSLDSAGKPAGMKQFPRKYPCKLTASRSLGVLSVSAHEFGVMMTVRLDDIRKIVDAAYGTKS